MSDKFNFNFSFSGRDPFLEVNHQGAQYPAIEIVIVMHHLDIDLQLDHLQGKNNFEK